MADDSVPIFSKVEATLSSKWLRSDGSNVTDVLNKIERAAKENIEIRFRNGKYILCGSLFHINAVYDLLSRKDGYPHLQLEFTDDSLLSTSGPPSSIFPNRHLEALYVHQESQAEESGLEFVTTYTDGDRHENLVSDVSEKSEATQRSASMEIGSVEIHDKSADMSDTVSGGFDKKGEISNVKTTEKGAGVNYTTASDTDNHDKSCNVDLNDKSAETSDRVAGGIDKKDTSGTSTDDVNQTIDANNCSSGEDNHKESLEVNKGQENEIFSDERIVDPEIWDYVQKFKCSQLCEMLEPFGASYKSEWDAGDDVYRVRLVIRNQITNENSQKSITLACDQFDRLYNESFSNCEVEPINTKYFSGSLSVNYIRTKFPNILLKHSDENVLLIGPRDDVQKARKRLVSNSKKVGRMHKSFSASSSRSCVDLTNRGEATEHRACQSAIFTANDSLTSAEDAESLKDKVEEDLKSKSLTTDEAQAKDEKVSNQLVSAENKSAGTNLDGCGDVSTATEFEHLDNNNDRHEKSSSSDSFSILQSSPSSSFDDAEVALK